MFNYEAIIAGTQWGIADDDAAGDATPIDRAVLRELHSMARPPLRNPPINHWHLAAIAIAAVLLAAIVGDPE